MTKVVKSVGALFSIVLLACGLKGPASHPYDVVVMGGTPSGVAAAVAAYRQGAKVCLIAQNEHLGGMMASGLGNTDSGNPNYIGGIAAEVFRMFAKKGKSRRFNSPCSIAIVNLVEIHREDFIL